MEDGKNNRDEIFSKSVRAGKRTYFFDVKSTRGNDLYLTITESKRKFGQEGKVFYEKHKLFLYKEDFDKFSDGLEEAIAKIQELRDSGQYVQEDHDGEAPSNHTPGTNHVPQDGEDDATTSEFTDIDFDDLDDGPKDN